MSTDFAAIDRHIAWAEAESKKGEKSKWNQEDWGITKPTCGTAFCIAGHVAAEAGYRAGTVAKTTDPNFVQPGRTFAWREWWDYVLPPGVKRPKKSAREFERGYDQPTDHGYDEVAQIGYKFLGHREAEMETGLDLFDGDNSLADLKYIRDAYASVYEVPLLYGHEQTVTSVVRKNREEEGFTDSIYGRENTLKPEPWRG